MTDILRIFDPAGLPMHWVVENETTGDMFIVPAVANGWEKRSPYRGYRQVLRTVSGYNFIGLGVPLRRLWPEVCHDHDGRN